ncbi:MAG: ATP-dependent Clp protease proteolytic subunit [Planctomycetes bacterium]|nr:ATP-dependent Clp protease proteolytic subunit [Planctomycetota bacterium]
MDHHPYRILKTMNQQAPPYQRYREMSIEDMLLENRIIFLAGPINERTASIVIMRLLYLQSIKKEQMIHLYINSPGGLVDQTLAIYDTMQFLGCDVATYCIGQAASMAALLVAAGTKGKRFGLPNSRLMLHQPWGGTEGTASDIKIQADEIIAHKKRMNRLYAKHTGRAEDQVAQDSDRDYYMGSQEAKAYGLLDEVVESLKDLPGQKGGGDMAAREDR